MKDSGIEWIGEIPEGWETINPKALFTQRKDRASKGERQLTSSQQYGILYQDEYMELTGSKVVTVEKDFDILKHVEAGDFVISMRSFQGGLEYSTKSGAISSAYVMLVPNLELVYPRFYRWLLKSSVYIDALQRTTNMVRDGQAMRYSNFAQVRLFTLPLDEQKSRADFLDVKCSSIDKILSKTRASIEEYKKLKQAVITQAVTKGVRGEREMKDSGVEWIWEIPKEWVIQKIKSISSRINVGVVIRPSEYFDENGTVPFLRGINVKEYLISSDNMVYINESSNRILSKSQVHTDDILIVRDGSIGTSCVVPAEFDGANVVSMVIATPSISCDSRFVCYSLNSDVGKTQFTLTKIGSALTHTSVSAVSDIIIAVPSCAEQKEIADYLDAKCAEIDKLIAKKEQLVKELESYKKSLIYEVVTGKREV